MNTLLLVLRHFTVLIVFILGTSSVEAAREKLVDTPLQRIKGLTTLQKETANAIQTGCMDPSFTKTTSAQQELSDVCSSMVGNTRDLSDSQMGSALQHVATEEMATPSKISTNTLSGQVSSINSHLLKLHNLGGGSGDENSLVSKGFSTFLNGVGGVGDIKASSQEDGANFNNAGVILGADYRITDNFLVGLAGGYSNISSDYIQNANVSGGSINADIFNLSLFSSYDIDDFYIDGSFSYGWSSYDAKRNIVILSNTASIDAVNKTATSNPNGEQYSTGLGLGYNFHREALNISPVVRVNYFHGQMDAYSERGAFGLNLDVDKQNFESLQSNVGGQVSYTFSQSFGIITPQIAFSYNHEFMNDSRNITSRSSVAPNQFKFSATTNSPDRDFFVFSPGVSSVLQGGVQLFFNYQTLLGYNRVTSHGFTGGVRLEF